jgi:catalase
MFDALYIPGGDESVSTLCDDDEALRFVRETFRHGKSIAASGDGVQVLRVAGLPLPDDARQAMLSGLIVELPRAGLGAMNAAFVAAIAQRRHWQRPALGGPLHA